jgi:hypothetical protein
MEIGRFFISPPWRPWSCSIMSHCKPRSLLHFPLGTIGSQ